MDLIGQEIVLSIWILMMISGIVVAKRDKRIRYLFIYNELEGSDSRFPLSMNSRALHRLRNKFLSP
jgi:hypothetical protein